MGTLTSVQQQQDAVGNSRLRPGAATWRTTRNVYVVFDYGLFSPLYENMTSFTKPEVNNVIYCRQRRTEPRPQITCTENLGKCGHVVFEICERTERQTDRQTDTRIAILHTLTSGAVIILPTACCIHSPITAFKNAIYFPKAYISKISVCD